MYKTSLDQHYTVHLFSIIKLVIGITPMDNQFTGDNPIPGSRLVYFFF